MNNELQTVKIMLDYLQGPIWFSDVETGGKEDKSFKLQQSAPQCKQKQPAGDTGV